MSQRTLMSLIVLLAATGCASAAPIEVPQAEVASAESPGSTATSAHSEATMLPVRSPMPSSPTLFATASPSIITQTPEPPLPELNFTPIPTVPFAYPLLSSQPDGALNVIGPSLDVSQAEVSPDGQYKVAVAPYGVAVYNAADDLLWAMQATGRVEKHYINFKYDAVVLEIDRSDNFNVMESLVAAWDLRTGALLKILHEGEGRLFRWYGLEEGTTVYFESWNHAISLWHIPTNTTEVLQLDDIAQMSNLSDIEWSPDGTRLALSGRHNSLDTLYLYDITSGINLIMEDPVDDIGKLAFHPSGNLLYGIAGTDYELKQFFAWRINGELAFEIDPFLDEFTLSQTRRYILGAYEQGSLASPQQPTMGIWDAYSGEPVQMWHFEDSRWLRIRDHIWNADDSRLLVTYEDQNTYAGHVMVLSPESDTPLVHLAYENEDQYVATSLSARWSDNEQQLTISIPDWVCCFGVGQPRPGNTTYVVDARTGALLSEERTEPPPVPNAQPTTVPSSDTKPVSSWAYGVLGLALSPDEQLLASLTWTGLEIYELASGDLITYQALPLGYDYYVEVDAALYQRLAFSPDSEFLAMGGQGVRLFDMATRTLSEPIPVDEGYIYDVFWMPDGETLGAVTEDKVLFISVETGKTILPRLDGGLSAELSPDGAFLATRNVLYNTENWEPICEFSHRSAYTNDFAFSPDGQYVAVAEGLLFDGMVEVYRVSDCSVVHQMLTERYAASQVAWSAKGDRLFVSYGLSVSEYGGDLYNFTIRTVGTVLAWDPFTGTLLHQLPGHADGVQALAINYTEDVLYTGAANGTLIAWDLDALH